MTVQVLMHLDRPATMVVMSQMRVVLLRETALSLRAQPLTKPLFLHAILFLHCCPAYSFGKCHEL